MDFNKVDLLEQVRHAVNSYHDYAVDYGWHEAFGDFLGWLYDDDDYRDLADAIDAAGIDLNKLKRVYKEESKTWGSPYDDAKDLRDRCR
jgi:hypothetical protein